MKCVHLIATGEISACAALGKPYVPSLFDLCEYCKTIDHRKCPHYLKGLIYTDQVDSKAGAAYL